MYLIAVNMAWKSRFINITTFESHMNRTKTYKVYLQNIVVFVVFLSFYFCIDLWWFWLEMGTIHENTGCPGTDIRNLNIFMQPCMISRKFYFCWLTVGLGEYKKMKLVKWLSDLNPNKLLEVFMDVYLAFH